MRAMTDAQFDRLPKYAKDEILMLERHLKNKREYIEDLQGKRPKTRINANPYHDAEPLYLEEHGPVAYQTTTGEIRTSLRKSRSGIYTLNINGATALNIRPNSSNDVTVTLEQW